MKWTTLYILKFFLIICTVCTVRADEIVLKNGNIIRGRIMARTDNRITIQNDSGMFSFRKENIKNIREESNTDNNIIDAEISMAQNDPETALYYYLRALREGDNLQTVHSHIKENSQKILEAISETGSDDMFRIKEILANLDSCSLSTPTLEAKSETISDFRFMITRFMIEAGASEKPADILSDISDDYYDARPDNKKVAVEFFRNKAKKEIAEQDFDNALQTLQNLNVLDVEAGSSEKMLLYLRWGANLRDQKQWKETAEIYTRKIAPFSGELSRNRMIVLFREMTQVAETEKDLKRAITVMKDYRRRVPPKIYNELMGKALVSAGKIQLENGKLEMARELFERSFSVTGIVDKDLLALCEYREALDNLKPGDYLGHYELAGLCRRLGLDQKAKKHYQIAETQPELAPAVQEKLRNLNDRNRLKILNQAMELYDNEQYTYCLDSLQTLFDDAVSTGGIVEAQKLADLCRKKLELESSKRPKRAMILFQQAERYFLSEEFDSAIVKLELLLNNYPDTSVAPKARRLLTETFQRKEQKKLRSIEEGENSPEFTQNEIDSESSELQNRLSDILDNLNNEQKTP